jgi:hypothetical protein
MIVSRRAPERSADTTRREQWISYRKMILMLDDNDLRQMIQIRGSDGDPADLIRQKIEDFRLGF